MRKYVTFAGSSMVRNLFAAGSVLVASMTLSGQPTTNPVSDSGIDVGAYDLTWVNALPWASVTTTAATPNDGTYNADGTIASGDDLATVQAEIFALSGSGGGILYFPAGSYDFSDHLYMADGVILRGATSAAGDCRGSFSTDGSGVRTYTLTYDPGTDFNFPLFIQDFTTSMRPTDPNRAKYFKQIRVGKSDGGGGVLLDATEASNYGIVNVDIDGAIITIGDRNEVSTWGTEIPKNEVKGQNILIFGNRINNGTALEPSIPTASQNAWQIWPTRTRGKIDAVTAGNTLVANNLIADKHYKYYVLGDSSQTLLDYVAFLNQSGLPTSQQYKTSAGGTMNAPNDVARFSDAYGVRLNHVPDYQTAHSAVQEPSKHRLGQGIINNFYFGTTRVGFMGAGNGLIVKGNVREDFKTTKFEYINEQGTGLETNNSATQENRGIDVTGGHDVIIDDNYVRVKRGQFVSGYPTIDGEGILLQESSSTVHPWNWTIRNNIAHSYLGIYRVQHANGILFEGNTVFNDSIYTDGSRNGSQGHVGGTVTFTNNTATSIYAKYTIKPRDFSFIDGGGNSPAATAIEDGNDGVGPGATLVDAIPQMEILYPTYADMGDLTPGATVTVQVEVTRNPADTTAVNAVKIWDGITNYPANGKMNNSYWGFDGTTSGQPAGIELTLVTPDPVTGAIGGGIYEGSWTVPADFDKRGLLVAELRLLIQSGIAGDWTEKSWAFMSEGSSISPAAPDPIVIAMGTGSDIDVSFDSLSGLNYQLEISIDGMSTWNDVGSLEPGTGSEMTLTHAGGQPASGDKVFYRVTASN